jgi:small-conductance mechanosensitive channel
MVAAAIDIVTSYAPVPPRLQRLTDIFFIVAATFQAAIWAREIILGTVRSRVGENPGETTLGNAMAIIRVLVSVAVFAIAIIVILDNLGVNVTTLVAGLGIGGIAIGLAAQGIFADLFAALSIVFDRPFRRGDTVRFGTTTGTVERIGLKTTRVRAVGGEQVIVSNTKLLEQEVSNLAEAKVRRVTITFGLVYRTSPDVLEGLAVLVEPVIKGHKNCRLVRALATGFGPSSIDCEIVYDHRTNDADAIARTKSEILIEIARLFTASGVEFAYPTQTTFTAAPDGTLVMPYAPPAPTK